MTKQRKEVEIMADDTVKKGVAKTGDVVRVEYEGRFTDGTLFDSSEKAGRPLEFQIGSGMVIKGFEKALKGMKPGEERSITLKPKEAYGMPNPGLIREVPRPAGGENLKEGAVMLIGLPNGQRIPAKVVKLGKEKLTIDINHPLAGKTLKFKLKLLEIV